MITPASANLPPIRKRDDRLVAFDRHRIQHAITAAFRAELNLAEDELDVEVRNEVSRVTDSVVSEIEFIASDRQPVGVEAIQDLVEAELMRAAHYNVARRYILYRQQRAQARALRDAQSAKATPTMFVAEPDGSRRPMDFHRIKRSIYDACRGLADRTAEPLIQEVFASLYDGMTPTEVRKATILAARGRIERDPMYGKAAVRLLLRQIEREAIGEPVEKASREAWYRAGFASCLKAGVEAGRIDTKLLGFDLERITAALHPQRDEAFDYLGLQTVYDRYLLHIQNRRIELPQYFWMRVAMGLALNEGEQKEARAIEFYELLSSFRFVSATPTLFNSGTPYPQLSSCYLSTVADDLTHIFKVVGDNAALSKWAGGLGNDWTSVRATGAHIKGTNGESQGVIPFLKIVNDTAIAVNQGGKRKGAVCCYMEVWHLDFEDFSELRKNTGDDRRRTHDMHTAAWIPDLFMKRVQSGGHWTLFSPDEVSDLHETYGRDFEARYTAYEEKAERGGMRLHKRVEAVALWRRILSMLFETGHPWITFKDPSNVRSPQDHVGVVHNSNLCTEILLNTSRDETAVCNLGSINLALHTTSAGLDRELIAKTVRTAVRMLDNVIDINFYPTPEARNANMRHRPVGMGIMAFQDALVIQRLAYGSEAAMDFADTSMEVISYHALQASSDLAAERGTYSSYAGSKWERGLLPIDTIALLEAERGGDLDMNRSTTLDWDSLRETINRQGMRNSNVMAIAPTATISNIAGVGQSIEPLYRNLFVKSNLSGDFTIVNEQLVADLKRHDLWDSQMIDDLKYFDGSIQAIDRIPENLKELYKTALEIEPLWLIEAASRRQKWIDMGQSLNLYMVAPNGRQISDMYFLAWRKGLKTTYYLRSQAATQIEKSSLDVNARGIQPRWMKNKSASSNIVIDNAPDAGSSPESTEISDDESTQPKACSLANPDCEACQ